MKVAFVYATKFLFARGELAGRQLRLPEPADPTIARLSTSKTMILELKRQDLIAECEQWRFWDRPSGEIQGSVPLNIFSSDANGYSADLARHVQDHGPPDVLWIEGRAYPPNLEQIFELCADSFKVIYTQEWKPWRVEGLRHYNLCLLDEERHVDRMKTRHPGLRCAVWDKLIDYEARHYPLRCEKAYDLCYVAYLNRRKNHELLFRAMAKFPDRKLSCVCVGGDDGAGTQLAQRAGEWGLSVLFTGEATKDEVNAYISRSRIGVVCSKRDAAPRILLEYMAADVPVLVNAELRAGTRYVGPQAGLVRSPEEFHLGIAELLDNSQAYSPRAYVLEHYSRHKVVAKLVRIFEEAGCRLGRPRG